MTIDCKPDEVVFEKIVAAAIVMNMVVKINF